MKNLIKIGQLIGWLFCATPAAVQAQFNYSVNADGTATITGYTGSGGAVTIPSMLGGYPVTRIGGDAFETSPLTSVAIPDSVTNIGIEAFAACSSLTNIMVSMSNPDYSSLNGVLFHKNEMTLVQYPAGIGGSYVIPDNVTNLGIGAFQSSGLASITIPTSLISIGASAFSGTFLTGITIPGSVTSIGNEAFVDCDYLKSVFFQGNAPANDGTTFSGDPATVYYLTGTTGWGTMFGGVPTSLFYSPFGFSTNGGTVTVTKYLGTNTTVTIPASINNLPVIGIGASAFSGTSLISITIPNTVTSIGGGAFQNCGSLTSATIPDGVTNIEEFAFAFCSNLVGVAIGSHVTGIDPYAFEYCGRLAGVAIPNSVTSIGANAFAYCTNLFSASIGSGVTSIGANAFIHCSLTNVTIPNRVLNLANGAFAYCNMTSLIIPDNVTNIGDGAFSFCHSLASAIIGNRVTTIGNGAFGVCSNLASVTIGSGVTGIGSGAFGTCPDLKSAYFEGNAPPNNGSAFAPSAATIYYLPGTKGWTSTFGSRPTALWNPKPVAAGRSGGEFGFNITGPANAAIVVEASANLSSPVWIPVGTNTLSGSGISSFGDPQSSNYSNRYYRFRSE